MLTNPGFENGLSGPAGGVGQVIDAAAGQTYTLNGWSKVVNGAIGRIGIRFYDSNWANLATFTSDVPHHKLSTPSDWAIRPAQHSTGRIVGQQNQRHW